MLSGVTAVADTIEVAALESATVDVLANDVAPEGTSIVEVTSASHGTVELSNAIPDELVYEYESSGGAYYYGSIDAYVNDYYGGWQGYADYQSYVYGEEYSLPSAGVTYTSTDPSYSGQDSFTYTIEDAAGVRSTSTVTVNITGNAAPDAVADSVSVAAGESIEISPLANDVDPEGTSLTLVSFDQPSNGTVEAVYNAPEWLEYEYQYAGSYGGYSSIDDYVNDYYGGWEYVLDGEGSAAFETLRFTATDPSYSGTTTFTYTVRDEAGNESTGTVSVEVIGDGPAVPPSTADDHVSLDAGAETLVDVLANDVGVTSLVSIASAALGEATIDAATGSVRYVSDPTASGTDLLTYTATDGTGVTLTGTLTVQVAALAPTPHNDQAEVVAGESLLIDVTANDADPNGLDYAISLVDPNAGDHIALVRRAPTELLAEYDALDGDMFYGSVEAYVSQRYGSWELYRDAYAQQGLGEVNVNQFDVAFDASDLAVGQHSFNYAITNVHGESATATVSVNVVAPPADETAETEAPVEDEADTDAAGDETVDDTGSSSSGDSTSDPSTDDSSTEAESTGNDSETGDGDSTGFASDDAVTVNGGEDVEFQPLANDNDSIGGGLRIIAFTQPTHGTVSFVHETPEWLELEYSYAGDYGGFTSLDDYVAQNFGGWSAVYADARTPPATTLKYASTDSTFSGEDSFTYIVENAAGETAVATVAVAVSAADGSTAPATTTGNRGTHPVQFQGKTIYVYTVEAQQEIQGLVDEYEASQLELNNALADFVAFKQTTDELLLDNRYAYDFAVAQAEEAEDIRADEIEDEYNQAITNADQAYTLGVSQLEQAKIDALTQAQAEFDNAMAAANSIADDAVAAAEAAYGQAIEAADNEYDAAEATARATRDATILLAQQTRDASLSAADDERDLAFANAENTYDGIVSAADASLETALQAASDARHAEIAAAQQAYDAIYATHSANAGDVSGAIAFLATWSSGNSAVDPATTQAIQQTYDNAIDAAAAAFDAAASAAADGYNGSVQPVYDSTVAEADLAKLDYDNSVDQIRSNTDQAVEAAHEAYNDAIAGLDAAHQATIDDLTADRIEAIASAEESAIDAVEAKAVETEQAVIDIEIQLGQDVENAEDSYVESVGNAGASTAASLQEPSPAGDPVDIEAIGAQLQSDSQSLADRMNAQIAKNTERLNSYTADYENATDDEERAQIIKDYAIESFKEGNGQVKAARATAVKTHELIANAQATSAKSANDAAAEHSLALNELGYSLTKSLISAKAQKEGKVSSDEAQASIDSRGEAAALETKIADEVKSFRKTVSSEDEAWSRGVAASAHATEAAKIEAAAARDRAISNAYKAEADQLGLAGLSFASLSSSLMNSFYGTVDAAELAYLSAIQSAEQTFITAAINAARNYHEATIAAGEAAIAGYAGGSQALSDAGFDADSIAIAIAHYDKAERQSRAMFTERRSRLQAATTYVTDTENASLQRSNTQQVANETRKVSVREAQFTYDVTETEAENDYQREVFDADAKRFDKALDEWEGAANSANDAALANANAAAAAGRAQADAATNASHQASTQQISEDTKRHNAGVNAGKTKTSQSIENAVATGTALADAAKQSVETETQLGKEITEKTIDITAKFDIEQMKQEQAANDANDKVSLDAIEGGDLHSYYIEAQLIGTGSSLVVDYTGYYADHALFGEASEPESPWYAMTVDEALDAATSFGAGFGDQITLGLTEYIREQMGTNVYVNQSSLAYDFGRIGGEAWQFAFGMATGCVGFSAATKAQKAGMVYGYMSDARDLAELGGKVVDGTATVTDVAFGLSGYAFGRVFSRGCFVAGTPVHLGSSETVFVSTVGGYGAETVMSTSDSLFVEADMKWVVASIGLAAAGMLLMSGDRKKSKPAFVPAYARARRKPGNVAEPDTHESLASFDELTPGFEPTEAIQRALRGEPMSEPAEQNVLVDVQPSTVADMPFVTADEMFATQPTKRPSVWKKWSSVALLLLASVCLFKGLPGLSVDPAGSVVASVDSSVAAQTSRQSATLPIEDIRCGMRVAAGNPLEGFDQPDIEIDSATWRLVSLFWETPTGSLKAETLRPLNWIDAHGGVGGYVAMGTSEIETVGYARITAVNDCPEIHDGPGRIVTTTYRHSPKPIFDVLVEGEPDPIGATGNHPFWSEDRQDFVRADELIPGERLRRNDQSLARVTSITHRGPPEPVYNLEVDAEHVYHVGQNGLLVHNTTPNCTAIGRMDDLANYDLDDAVDTWRKSGRLPLWDGGPVTWNENAQWIKDRIARGDRFVLATDPKDLPSPRLKPGQKVPPGYFTARELELLAEQGVDVANDF